MTDGHEGAHRDPGRRRAIVTIVAVAVALVALLTLGVLGFVLYARGGGPVPDWLGGLRPGSSSLLAPSGPEETVLRTLRLAGYRDAVVGEEDGVVVVRVAVPSVATAPDVALTVQTAMAAATAAYPDAKTIAAQVFDAEGQALVEAKGAAPSIAAAVDADDVGAFRKALEWRYLSESER